MSATPGFTRREDDASLSRLLVHEARVNESPAAKAADAYATDVLRRIVMGLETGDPDNSLEADLDGLKAKFLTDLGL